MQGITLLAHISHKVGPCDAPGNTQRAGAFGFALLLIALGVFSISTTNALNTESVHLPNFFHDNQLQEMT